jgi:hypothetical protein
LEPESSEAATAVQHAQGVSEVLRHNIVQGRQIEGTEDKYKLQIHEDTERGYNDTVKNPKAPGGYVKVGCWTMFMNFYSDQAWTYVEEMKSQLRTPCLTSFDCSYI